MAERSGVGLKGLLGGMLAMQRKSLDQAWPRGVSLATTDPRLSQWVQGGDTYTGRNVTDNSAMQVSAVWACVRILAESVGQLPWSVLQRQSNGNMVKVDGHPLGDLLNLSPNVDMTTIEFREAVQVNLGLRGNGYCFRDTNGAGRVSSLYPVESWRVTPHRKRDTGELVYNVIDRGRTEQLPREKIWHVKGFGSNGLVGFSPIGFMRQAIGLSLATEEFQARFFGNGGRPSAVASIPQWLKPDQRAEARENLLRLFSGLENAHKVQLLEGGMKLEPWAQPLDDLQFLQLRQFNLEEICRIYGVPPHRIADLSHATFSNIEQLSLEFVMFTLLPWLRRWEESANRWLLLPKERGSFTLQFNFEGLLRADTTTRGEFLSKMVAAGIMARNEARAKNNQNRVDDPGMDAYTVQSNMISVDDLQAVADAMRGNAGGKPPTGQPPAPPAPVPAPAKG